MSPKIDILGSGLAGVTLALEARRRKLDVRLLPTGPPPQSLVAAGMVNPVGFKRWTESYMASSLIPSLNAFYDEVALETGVQSYSKIDILRRIPNLKEAQHFSSKQHQIAEWVRDELDNSIDFEMFPFGTARIRGAGWLNLPLFLESSLAFLKEEGIVGDRRCDAQLIRTKGSWEGEFGRKQMLVRWNKGEILDVHIPGLNEDYILNAGFFILPRGNQMFRVGSTYESGKFDPFPTAKGRRILEEKLSGFLGPKYPFSVKKHLAGTRPTTLDRRPLLGELPNGDVIFNGLGTKGVMLAPFFAQHLLDFLQEKGDLNPEVNVKRFL